MWVCEKCKGENGDASNICISCGERKDSAIAPSSPKASEGRPIGQRDRTCPQACELENWGRYIYIITWVAGAIVFIASGFTFELNRYGEPEQIFKFTSLLGGILPALAWVLGGKIFKIIASSASVVVEAAYRSLRPDAQKK